MGSTDDPEYFSRYEALGMPVPDAETMCIGHCEGTGYVPIYVADNLPPDVTRLIPIEVETDPVFLALWHTAEARSHAEDGWHFVPCPECEGTGLRKRV